MADMFLSMRDNNTLEEDGTHLTYAGRRGRGYSGPLYSGHSVEQPPHYFSHLLRSLVI